MFNTSLAIDTLAHIEQSINEDTGWKWAQTDWGAVVIPIEDFPPEFYKDDNMPLCGTGMCFAGWALSLTGVRMAFGPATQVNDREVLYRAYYTTKGVPIEAAASRALGLNAANTDWDEREHMPVMFRYDNSLDHLYMYVAEAARMDEAELRVAVKDRLTVLDAKQEGDRLTTV